MTAQIKSFISLATHRCRKASIPRSLFNCLRMLLVALDHSIHGKAGLSSHLLLLAKRSLDIALRVTLGSGIALIELLLTLAEPD